MWNHPGKQIIFQYTLFLLIKNEFVTVTTKHSQHHLPDFVHKYVSYSALHKHTRFGFSFVKPGASSFWMVHALKTSISMSYFYMFPDVTRIVNATSESPFRRYMRISLLNCRVLHFLHTRLKDTKLRLGLVISSMKTEPGTSRIQNLLVDKTTAFSKSKVTLNLFLYRPG